MEYSHFKEHTDRVVESCSRVIVGKEETVRLIFISFLCSGHVLLGGRAGKRERPCF